MKLIKYFFTIPFSPMQEWKKAHKAMDASKNLKEDAIFVFLVLTILSIGYSYLYDFLFGGGYFTIETLFLHYFSLIIITLFTLLGIRMMGGLYKTQDINDVKLFIVVVLGTGFVKFLSNFVFIYLEPWLYYSVLSFYLLKLVIYIILALLIVLGLMANRTEIVDTPSLTKMLPGVFFTTMVLIGVNVVYSYASEYVLTYYFLYFG